MSLEDDGTSNLPELTPISSNQHVQKGIQNSTITTVHTSRGSSSTSFQEQSLVVKTRYKETRKRHHHIVSSSEDSDVSNDNDTPTYKCPRVNNSHHSCVQSSTAPAHHRDDDTVIIPDEEEMNRNLKAL